MTAMSHNSARASLGGFSPTGPRGLARRVTHLFFAFLIMAPSYPSVVVLGRTGTSAPSIAYLRRTFPGPATLFANW